MGYNPEVCQDSENLYLKIKNNVVNSTFNYKYYITDEFCKAYAQNYERVEQAIEEAKKEKKRKELRLTQEKNKRLRALVKHINWSENCCIVYWNDGTQTKSFWNPLEDFDAEKAILVCMARKLYENTNIYNEVIAEYEQDGWDHYEEERVWSQYV